MFSDAIAPYVVVLLVFCVINACLDTPPRPRDACSTIAAVGDAMFYCLSAFCVWNIRCAVEFEFAGYTRCRRVVDLVIIIGVLVVYVFANRPYPERVY